MKFVVPLTIPWMRSMGVADSDSSSTRTTGTAPATAASKRSLHAPLAGGLEELLAVLGEELLVGGDHVLAGAYRAERVLPCRFDPADQLDEQIAVGEDLLEVVLRCVSARR